MTGWAEAAVAAEPDCAAALTLLPQGLRMRMLALMTLGHELDRAARASAEPMLNEIRLQWWIEALGQLPQGAGQHPLLGALAENWPGEGARLAALAEGWRRRCDPAGLGSVQAVMAGVEATAAGLAWLGASALGAEAEAEAAVRAQGRALGAAAMLAQGLAPVLAPGVAAAGRAAAAEAAAQARHVPRSAAPVLYAGPLVRWRLADGKPPSEFARRAALLRFAVTRNWRISLPR